MLAERRIGKGLEGLVQVDELVRDPCEPFLVVEAAVQRVDLVAEPVEPFENGVELPVVELVAVGRHTPILTVLGRAAWYQAGEDEDSRSDADRVDQPVERRSLPA